MSSLRHRDGRQRTERFAGGTPRRAPTAALERKAEVELQMCRGSYVAREAREERFRLLYQRWWDSRQISETRRYTDAQRAAKHVLPYWGDWPICTIRPSDLDDWVGPAVEDDRAPVRPSVLRHGPRPAAARGP